MKLNIRNSDQELSVQNLYGVAMNYHDHAKELGNPIPEKPVFFMMSSTTITKSNSTLRLPYPDAVVHYEGELVVVIGYDCGNIPEKLVDSVILGYGVGIDYTLREEQKLAKSKGHPWTLCKNFFGSAPLSEIVLKEDIAELNTKSIVTTLNGKICQNGTINDMVFSVTQLVSYLSKRIPLLAGDIIFTGTPAGVGPVRLGDEITCSIEGISEVTSRII